MPWQLDFFDFFGLGASITRFYLKTDAVTLREGLESRCLDGGIVHKNIITIILSYKTVSLLSIKPFHGSLWHNLDLLSEFLNR